MNFVLTFYECRRLGSCGGDLQIDESSFPALSKPRRETGLDREMISGFRDGSGIVSGCGRMG